MSDFVTRMVQRQRGELPTVQPRIPSLFAPLTNRPEAPMSEIVMEHRQPVQARESEPAPEMEKRLVQGSSEEEIGTRSVSPLVPSGAQPIGNQQVEQPPAAQSQRQTPVAEDRPPMKPLLTESPVRRKAAHEAQRDVYENQALPIVERRPSDGAKPERRPTARPVEVPPRLVREEIQSRVEQIHAPPSLVSRDSVGRRPRPIIHDPVEPPVQVTIGRIEVTAATPPSTPKHSKPVRQPAVTLQDYLAQRQRRSR